MRAESAALRRYVLSRVLLFPPTLILVSIAIFLMMRVLPGDVALLILGGSGEATDARAFDPLDSYQQALRRGGPLPLPDLQWAGATDDRRCRGSSPIGP